MLNQLAQQEKRHGVGNTRRLLHVVRDNNQGVMLFKLHCQLLDHNCRDGIESRGGLVHKQDLGLDGERAGDAQALLLATGKTESGALELILYLVPQRRAAQRLLDQAIKLIAILDTKTARTVGHVIVDAHGKRIGALENHTHALAQTGHVVVRVDVRAVQRDGALDTAILNAIVHSVEAAQQRGLAAAGRTDKRRDLTIANGYIDVFKRMVVAVEQVQMLHAQAHIMLRFGRLIRIYRRRHGLPHLKRARRRDRVRPLLLVVFHSLPPHKPISSSDGTWRTSCR